MQFVFDTCYETIPSVPPPGEPVRKNPTTQIIVLVVEWPSNTFRLWLPECVSELWDNETPDLAYQDFMHTVRNGLLWTFEGDPNACIEAEVIPLERSLLLEVRVTNLSKRNLNNLAVMNCLQLAAAPDFACNDFSRIYIRSDGQWQPLSTLNPTCDFPFYYRAGFLKNGGVGWAGGRLAHCNQVAEVDHSLIVCVSKDGDHSVGTASENYQFLFHNRANEDLLCIHSQQAPVPVLGSGETAIFRQNVFFVEGGLTDCVAAFEADVERNC